MAEYTILVIEDEPDIQELIRVNLAAEGYRVESASTGSRGLDKARQLIPDLILLDLMLPEVDGWDVCRRLRNDDRTRAIPIIMLTARSEDVDIVTGLEVGADDYITKPFSPRVLIARIRAVVRRQRAEDDDGTGVLRAGEIMIDLGRHTVTANDQSIELTPTEFLLLVTLIRRPGWVYSRNQLVDEVRGTDTIITDRAVDVQIVGLRKKLGEFGHYVETVRGVGYRFREL